MRGKKFKKRELDIIRLLVSKGYSVREIADFLPGRGKSGVHGQIQRMKEDGSIKQGVLDMGQTDERN